MKSLSHIKSEVTRLSQVLDASSDDLPTYGHTRDDGYPHVEVDDDQPTKAAHRMRRLRGA